LGQTAVACLGRSGTENDGAVEWEADRAGIVSGGEATRVNDVCQLPRSDQLQARPCEHSTVVPVTSAGLGIGAIASVSLMPVLLGGAVTRLRRGATEAQRHGRGPALESRPSELLG
jgi:hypothetical protein